MIGIRSAISIRARGQWPLLEAGYMTAPRFICSNTKKTLAEREPSIHDEGRESASSYRETVCTTLETGRAAAEVFGSFNSFASASSYSGSDASVVLALICTTL